MHTSCYSPGSYTNSVLFLYGKYFIQIWIIAYNCISLNDLIKGSVSSLYMHQVALYYYIFSAYNYMASTVMEHILYVDNIYSPCHSPLASTILFFNLSTTLSRNCLGQSQNINFIVFFRLGY